MRYIFHCDLNNFYASVECLENPSLRGQAVAVCGRAEDRHGIVLAKNYVAKGYGIKTGDTIWQAKQKCPSVKIVEARHDVYLKYSRIVRKIYYDYTNRIEPFGIDEAWLDVTGSVKNFEEAVRLADEIRERVKKEVGLTISVGVSFCKVFAKLGSDYKKPDATTLISPENFKDIVWPLPVGDLLFVGKKTAEKLEKLTIKTIGDLANFDKGLISYHFGKVGEMLQQYASGKECEEVRPIDKQEEIKSVGNSMTYYKDIIDREDIYALFLLLAESVSYRMKKYGFMRARNLVVSVRDNNLTTIAKMMKMTPATNLASEIADYAFAIFEKDFGYKTKVRGLGIHVSEFCDAEQLTFNTKEEVRDKKEKLEKTVDSLRDRFGRNSVQRAIVLKDERLKKINIVGDHVVTPAFKEKVENYTKTIINEDF